MTTIGKWMLLLAAVSLAAPASAAQYKGRAFGVKKAVVAKRTLVVTRSPGAGRKAETIFDQRREYMQKQENAAWNTYQAIKAADENRINHVYITTGKWADPNPAVGRAEETWNKLYRAPKP